MQRIRGTVTATRGRPVRSVGTASTLNVACLRASRFYATVPETKILFKTTFFKTSFRTIVRKHTTTIYHRYAEVFDRMR